MEKGNASIYTNCNNEEKRSVVLSDKLFNLIASVKEINLVTNMREVYDGLKKYICEKQLFDPQDPRKIHCKNDELGSIFGVQEFSIPDVATFLPKLVSPFYSEVASNTVGSTSKRKLDETSTLSKRSKIEELILYIPPSPTRDSVSDSAESFQGYETAIVKDTSDDNVNLSEVENLSDGNFSIVAVEETYNIEYEVNSVSSHSSDSFSTCSDCDSEMDALNTAILSVICKNDSDMEFWADKSSDDDLNGFDAEISDSDKWRCANCKSFNDPPNRFCERCFETRKGWLPSKRLTPKRKSRSRRKRVSMSKTLTKDEESTKNNPINVCEFPSTSSSQETNSSSQSTEKEMKQSDHFSLSSDSNFSNSKLCLLCCERPINGTIIHTNTKYAHTISCYPCARRLKNQKKKCPICRRSIDRVVYQISP